MGRNVRALTLRETVALMGELGASAPSERQVRYLLIEHGLGCDVDRRNHGRTRLYGPLDVALVRLIVAMREAGASAQVARVVMTYLRDDLIRAWRSAAPVGLAIRGVQATLEPAAKGRPPKATVWVPLRPIWQGLEARVQAAADTRESVWMYRHVAPHHVPRNTV